MAKNLRLKISKSVSCENLNFTVQRYGKFLTHAKFPGLQLTFEAIFLTFEPILPPFRPIFVRFLTIPAHLARGNSGIFPTLIAWIGETTSAARHSGKGVKVSKCQSVKIKNLIHELRKIGVINNKKNINILFIFIKTNPPRK